MPLPSSRREPKPAEVRFDRYAIFHLARQHHLSATDWALLVALVLLADWRDQTWIGTASELAKDARMSTTTIRRAVPRLETKGLLTVLSPFNHHDPAEVEILCYWNLVVPSGGRAAVAARLASSRVDLRDQNAVTSDDADAVRTKDAVKEGVGREPRATTGWEATPALGTYLRGAEPDDEPFPRSWVS